MTYEREVRAMYAEVLSARHPADRLIAPLVDDRGIEETRELLDHIRTQPSLSRWKAEIESVARRAEVEISGREIALSMDAWRNSLDQHTNGGQEPDFGNRLLEQAWDNHADLIIMPDQGWPAQVDELGHRAPIALWVKNAGVSSAAYQAFAETVANPHRPIAAVTGTRECSDYGARVSADLAQMLAEQEGTVINGGAYGAESSALRRVAGSQGGRAAVVLACGINRFYPAGNEDLLRDVAGNGVLISEQHPDAVPTRDRSLDRARLIAAIADTTIITEATQWSWTLKTAEWSRNLGRPTGAVAGSIYSSQSFGTNSLIQEGDAASVLGGQDVLMMAEETGRASFPAQAHLDAHSAQYQAAVNVSVPALPAGVAPDRA